MMPYLKTGYQLKIIKVDPSEIKISDIVVFGRDNPTCHRVVGVVTLFGRRFFLQRGDNSRAGGVCTPKSVVGKVFYVADERGREIPLPRLDSRSSGWVQGLGAVLYVGAYQIKHWLFGTRANRLVGTLNDLCWRWFHWGSHPS